MTATFDPQTEPVEIEPVSIEAEIEAICRARTYAARRERLVRLVEYLHQKTRAAQMLAEHGWKERDDLEKALVDARDDQQRLAQRRERDRNRKNGIRQPTPRAASWTAIVEENLKTVGIPYEQLCLHLHRPLTAAARADACQRVANDTKQSYAAVRSKLMGLSYKKILSVDPPPSEHNR